MTTQILLEAELEAANALIKAQADLLSAYQIITKSQMEIIRVLLKDSNYEVHNVKPVE